MDVNLPLVDQLIEVFQDHIIRGTGQDIQITEVTMDTMDMGIIMGMHVTIVVLEVMVTLVSSWDLG